jgi:hypothetical protein
MMKHKRFIEVFTTTVMSPHESFAITACLASIMEGSEITFDLEDIDRVLRVASPAPINNECIVRVVESFGFQADVMPDVVAEVV